MPLIEERLPAITCIADFQSGELARPGSEPFSSAAVVWFQEEFGHSVSEMVLAGIKSMDWESVAKDWMW